MALSAILAAALAGLLGGLHCAAMCGGWVAALSFRTGTKPLLPARTIALETTASHAGRIATYTLLGAALGSAGGGAFGIAWEPLQRPFYVLANVVLLFVAVSLLRRTARRTAILEGAGLAIFRRLIPWIKALSGRHRMPARFALGLMWGATPCALVYGVLPVAMLSGSAHDGALVMLAFGIGTLPNLLGASYILRRSNRTFQTQSWRVLASVLIATFAVYGIYRAVFAPSVLGQSPYCLFG